MFQESIKSPLIPYFDKPNILLKCENLQVFGSYKIRGIENLINSLEPDKLKDGLIAASAGNMGQSVAYVAHKLNLPCQIIVPESAPQVKINKIKKLGAKVLLRPYEEVWKFVQNPTQITESGYFIHPLNELVNSGYGQIAEELILKEKNIHKVFIPFGVGGLARGIARVLKKLQPSIKIIAVEPETASPLYRLKYNHDTSTIKPEKSIVDAIGTPEVIGQLRNEILELIDSVVTVKISDVKNAIKDLYYNQHMIVEGAGACALAAALNAYDDEEKSICILSGGNIDPKVLNDIILN
jgi:threonine dehydratase